MTKPDKDAAQHGNYGDTPLGKSDEELREEGAEALPASERHQPSAGQIAGGVVPVPLASVGGGVPGTALPVVGPGMLETQADLDAGSGEEKRDD